MSLQERMNRLFEESLKTRLDLEAGGPGLAASRRRLRDNDAFVVLLELPGVEQDDVEIHVDGERCWCGASAGWAAPVPRGTTGWSAATGRSPGPSVWRPRWTRKRHGPVQGRAFEVGTTQAEILVSKVFVLGVAVRAWGQRAWKAALSKAR